MASKAVRFNPIERQGPAPVRVLTVPQIVGAVVGVCLLVPLGMAGQMAATLVGGLILGVVLFVPYGEYRLVEWAVPLAKWVRQRVARAPRYTEGGTLPGPLADSTVIEHDSDDIVVGGRR